MMTTSNPKAFFAPFCLIGILSLFTFLQSCQGPGNDMGGDNWRIAVRLNDQWGTIDRDGTYIMNPSFDTKPFYWEGTFTVVGRDEKTNYFDRDGKPLPLKDLFRGGLMSEGLASFVDEQTGLVGYKDETGSVVIEPQFESGMPFNGGLAGVSVDKKIGYINKQGKFEINPQFDEKTIGLFVGDLSPVMEDDKWGFMDRKGQIKIPLQFDKAMPFQNELAVVQMDKNWGAIGTDGKFVINPVYKAVVPFFENVSVVVTNEKKILLIDNTGKVVRELPEEIEDATAVNEGLLGFREKDGQWGYMNLDGETIIQPQFRKVSPFFNERAIVQLDRKYGLVDGEGKLVVSPQFSDVDEVAANFGYGLIYFMGNLKEFSSRGTARGNPKSIAEKFLKAMKTNDFDTAKDLATKAASASIEMMAGMSEGGKGGDPDEIQIIDIETYDDRAVVSYYDNGKEMTLKLVLENDEWKAAWEKGGPDDK